MVELGASCQARPFGSRSPLLLTSPFLEAARKSLRQISLDQARGWIFFDTRHSRRSRKGRKLKNGRRTRAPAAYPSPR